MKRLPVACRAFTILLALLTMPLLAADAATGVPRSVAIHCPPIIGHVPGETWYVAGRRVQLGLKLRPFAFLAANGQVSLVFRFGANDSVVVGSGPPGEDDGVDFSTAYLRALADPNALPLVFEAVLAAHLGSDQVERFLSPSFGSVPVLRVIRGDRAYVHILVPYGPDFVTAVVEGDFDPCMALVVDPQGSAQVAPGGPGVVDVDALLSAAGKGTAAATEMLRRAGFVPVSEAR